jgi:hypothetical protein
MVMHDSRFFSKLTRHGNGHTLENDLWNRPRSKSFLYSLASLACRSSRRSLGGHCFLGGSCIAPFLLYVFSLVFVDQQYTSLISGCSMVSIVSSHGVLAVSLFTSYKRFRADTVSVLSVCDSKFRKCKHLLKRRFLRSISLARVELNCCYPLDAAV